MNKRLTVALIISGSIFVVSVCAFLWGCDRIYNCPKEQTGIIMVCISFFTACISLIATTRCKYEIDTVLLYGIPIHKVNQKIVNIINSSTGHGVRQLHGMLEKTINEQIKKAVEDGEKYTEEKPTKQEEAVDD